MGRAGGRVLLGILLLAALVRLVGIWHDYPYSYYPDEEHFVNRAVSFGSGDLNPHWFHKPAFLMYLLFGEYGAYFLVGKVLGTFSSIEDFAVSFFRSKGPFIIIGRITVALFGVATVWLTYLLGRSQFRKRTGLLAAFFVALTVGHVTNSQVVKADVPAAFFTTLSFLFILKIYDSGRFRDYLLAAVFAGLAMATKYYGVVLLPSLGLAHVLFTVKEKRRVMKRLLSRSIVVSFVIFWLVFFVASPYNFLDPLGLESSIVGQIKGLFSGRSAQAEENLRLVHGDQGSGPILLDALRQYVGVLLSPVAAHIIGALGLVGGLALVIRSTRRRWLFLSFPLVYVLVSSGLNPFYSGPRHMSVIYPFVGVLAAISIEVVWDWLSDRKWFQADRGPAVAMIACSLVVVAPSFWRIAAHDYRMTQPHSKSQAREWIENNIPAESRILIEDVGIPISPNANYYNTMIDRARENSKGQFTTHAEQLYQYSLNALPEITYDVTYIRYPWWQAKERQPGVYFANSETDQDMGNPLKAVGVMPYEYYARNGYEYALVSSEQYRLFLDDSRDLGEDFPSFKSFYQDLFEQGELLEEFRGLRGPTLRLYRIKNLDVEGRLP